MWIDFSPNPSIITGTSWKPTSRRWLRGLRKLRQERRVPLSFKVFVFPLTGGQPNCEGISCVSPAAFIQGWLQSPFWAFVSVTWLLDPKNAQTEKCDVGQITAVVPVKKKRNSYGQSIEPWLPPKPGFCACFPHTSLSVHCRSEWKLGECRIKRLEFKVLGRKSMIVSLIHNILRLYHSALEQNVKCYKCY